MEMTDILFVIFRPSLMMNTKQLNLASMPRMRKSYGCQLPLLWWSCCRTCHENHCSIHCQGKANEKWLRAVLLTKINWTRIDFRILSSSWLFWRWQDSLNYFLMMILCYQNQNTSSIVDNYVTISGVYYLDWYKFPAVWKQWIIIM